MTDISETTRPSAETPLHDTVKPALDYALIITTGHRIIANTNYASAADRRDGCVEILKILPRELRADCQAVQRIIKRSEGDPDKALRDLSDLYDNCGVHIFMGVGTQPMIQLPRLSPHNPVNAVKIPAAATEPADIRFALVITDDGKLVENSVHDTREERRDTCVQSLRENTRSHVSKSEINTILAEYDGADPDSAVGDISVLYAEEGIDVYLEDQTVPAQPERGVPPVIHSVLVSYSKAPNTIEHFSSIPDQAEYLRRRLHGITGVEQAKTTPTGILARKLQTALTNMLGQKVTVHLATSERPGWGL